MQLSLCLGFIQKVGHQIQDHFQGSTQPFDTNIFQTERTQQVGMGLGLSGARGVGMEVKNTKENSLNQEQSMALKPKI